MSKNKNKLSRKREKALIINFRKEKRNRTVTKKDTNVIREYCEQFYANTLKSVNGSEKFLEHLNGKK